MIILTVTEIVELHEKIIAATGLGIADGSIDYEHIVEWINAHLK